MEYEDDTHFCLKCNTTIVGLENYVSHRKASCSKSTVEPSKSSSPTQLLPADEIGPEADDFFSSLELRSSSKKPAVQSTSGKNFTGILTRSKISAAIQANTPHKDAEPSKSGKNVWIGGNQLKDLGTGDNQSKLIKAVAHLERQKNANNNSQSTSTFGAVYEDSEDDSEDYEYDEDESSEEDYGPPKNYTGGKWRPSSPVHWSNSTNRSGGRDWNVPPPSFTGGKWKPKSPLSPSYTKGKWKPLEDDSHPTTGGKYPSPGHTKGKWKSKMDNEDDRYPPASYTKGKWKPKVEDDNMVPPPSYTKGKWKPKLHEDLAINLPSSPTKGKWKPKTELENTAHKETDRSKYCTKPSSKDKLKSVAPKPSKSKALENWPKPFKPRPSKPLKNKHNREKDKKQAIKKVENDSLLGNISMPIRFWCYTCNRMLASKLVYERHLKSKLHFKRAAAEREFDNCPIIKKTKVEEEPSGLAVAEPSDLPVIEPSVLPVIELSGQPVIEPSGLIAIERSDPPVIEPNDLSLIEPNGMTEIEPSGSPVIEPSGLSVRELTGLPVVQPSGLPVVEPEKIESLTSNQLVKKRKRRKFFEICLVCRSRVNKYLMGKHLVSHYHYRKGDITSEASTNLVLNNILSVVLESPFQCSVCKFYCNTHLQFLDHWKSKFHLNHDKNYTGYFMCGFCNQKSGTSEEMLKHLYSPQHFEVISVINKSVPITIKKIHEISCLTCQKLFTLNVELLNHCRKTGHDSSNVSICKEEDYKCTQCNQNFLKAISLQRHFKKKHGIDYFFCGICNIKFKSSNEAKLHRMSLKHRYASMAKNTPKRLKRDCQYCEKKFPNFLLLKEHLQTDHPDHKIRCPRCGIDFIIPQELSNHLRAKLCKFPENPTQREFGCYICPFQSDSASEMLFHMALHNEPVIINEFDEKANKSNAHSVARYKCPLCEKVYPKYSLRSHLRLHTKERPYMCKSCVATFTRRSNLLSHEKNHERNQVHPHKKSEDTTFLCSTCGARFKRKCTLQQHMLTHTGKLCKCPQDGCIYSARKMSQLREHLKTHSSEKIFSCNICEYIGKTKKQLKRHMTVHDETKKYSCRFCVFTCRTSAHLKRHVRLHTGAKPFKCPYCEYNCNNMENLRRHVLNTTKHVGKCIYECKLCEAPQRFQTNAAKEFKAHLIQTHKEYFGHSNEAAAYISGIYEADKDNTNLSEERTCDRNSVHEAEPIILKTNTLGEIILELDTETDPVVAQQTQLSGNVTIDEMLPMLIEPQNEAIIAAYAWNLIGQYDVEESGDLVPFQSGQEEDLFQAHF